jgi:hypothetical protein
VTADDETPREAFERWRAECVSQGIPDSFLPSWEEHLKRLSRASRGTLLDAARKAVLEGEILKARQLALDVQGQEAKLTEHKLAEQERLDRHEAEQATAARERALQTDLRLRKRDKRAGKQVESLQSYADRHEFHVSSVRRRWAKIQGG